MCEHEYVCETENNSRKEERASVLCVQDSSMDGPQCDRRPRLWASCLASTVESHFEHSDAYVQTLEPIVEADSEDDEPM